MNAYRIRKAPVGGIDVSVPEDTLEPDDFKSPRVVDMLPTKRGTLRKRPGYRYLDSTSEGVVPIEIFEMGAISEGGLVPVVLWVGHQKLYVIGKFLLYPDNLSAAAGNAQVVVAWSEVEDATRYEVQYKLTSATDWTSASTTITGTSHTVTSLTNDSEYQFRVKAFGEGKISDYSNTVTATPVTPPSAPATPTGLSGTASQTSVDLTWTPVDNAVSYSIRHRLSTASSWTTVSSLTSPSYSVTGLTEDSQYDFQVRAVNGVGDSSWSSTVQVTTVSSATYFILNSEGPSTPGLAKIYTSSDQGTTWDNGTFVDSTSTLSEDDLTGFTVKNDGAWVVIDYGEILVNAGGRAIWEEYATNSLPTGYLSIDKSNTNNFYYMNRPGSSTTINNHTVYKSTDKGLTWDSGTSVTDPRSDIFINGSTPTNRILGAFAVDRSSPASTWYVLILADFTSNVTRAILRKTTDSGSTWTTLKTHGVSGGSSSFDYSAGIAIDVNGDVYYGFALQGNYLRQWWRRSGGISFEVTSISGSFGQTKYDIIIDEDGAFYFSRLATDKYFSIYTSPDRGETKGNSTIFPFPSNPWLFGSYVWQSPVQVADGEWFAQAQKYSGTGTDSGTRILFRNTYGPAPWIYEPSVPNSVGSFYELQGIDADNDGNFYVVNRQDRKFFKRVGTTWDSGTDLPAAATNARGIAVDDSNNIYIADRATRKFYIYNGTTWDSGTAFPATATAVEGVSVFGGSVYIVDNATRKIHRYSSGSWDAGVSLPVDATNPLGIAVHNVLL